MVSNSLQPHELKPTRLPCPWNSPGKNTGVGCHFLLQCMKVKSESEVGQSCPTLSDPMDCSLPGSSIHGVFQARVLEWGAIAFYATANWKHFCGLSSPSSYRFHCTDLREVETCLLVPSGDPGVSGDFWGSQEGCQGPFCPSGRNRALPLGGRRRRGRQRMRW